MPTGVRQHQDASRAPIGLRRASWRSILGVAGTNSSAQIQMAKLFAIDTFDAQGNLHPAGSSRHEV